MKNTATTNKTRRRHLLSAAISCICLQAAAQTEPSPMLENTLVIGQAASLNRALENQREANNVKTVVNADAIGQFPDANVSEALQRLPGLSIERDQGEGRFVRVRGLGPNLNAVNINGVRVPSPESGSRAVALDVIPSDLLDSLEVTKTLTPDMDADSLGGSINVKSLSAFDRDTSYYSLSLEGSYDEHSGETSPKASLAGSRKIGAEGNERFGVAGAVSWFERDFGSDNVETGGAWSLDDGEAVLEEMEQRDYTITRERLGVSLNFDFQPTETTQLYFRNLYSEYSDTETRVAVITEFADGDGLVAGQNGVGAVERELKDRKETLEIFSSSLGGRSDFNLWSLEYSASYSESSEATPEHIAGAIFEADEFDNVFFSGTRIPSLSLPESAYDAEEFELGELEVADELTTDTEGAIKLDISRSFDWGRLQAGSKLSRRDKDANADVWIYEDFAEFGINEDALLLSNYTGAALEHEYAAIGHQILASGLYGIAAQLDAEEFIDEEESRIGDFELSEDINAAYIMGTWETQSLRLLGGVRYESTSMSASGTALENDEFEPVTADNDYDQWLPSLHLRLNLAQDTLLRAAWTNSVVRPTFEQLAPGYVIEGDEAAFGNPDLAALESSNWDVGVEHYLGYASMMSAFLFYKDIDNFVYATDVAGTAGYEAYDEAETFRNGDTAELYGVELAYYKQFRELPAPWNGVLVGANGTWTDSSADISFANDDGALATRTIAFPSQSDLSYNVMLGYETSRLSVRLAANYKSEYLVEVADFEDASSDIYADEHLQIDLLARFYINDNLQVYFQGINLNDEPYYTYVGERAYNAQYEEYGPTYKLGVTLSNF